MGEKEFIASISELKKAEEEKQKIIGQALKEKEAGLKEARHEAGSIVNNAAKEAGQLKEEILAKARKDIKLEEDRILGQAKSEAEKMKAKKLGASEINKTAKSLLGA
jgi:ATP synthase H subunit